jgi:UDP-3-O-[3-hydroxymyristoyl] glucosamine N-acyltransferase
VPDPLFFEPATVLTLAEVAALVGAQAPERGGELVVTGLAPVERAKRGELTFLENPRYLEAMAQTEALACLVAQRHAARLPAHVVPLIVTDPHRSFARVAAVLFPGAMRLASVCAARGVSPGSFVDPSARLETGVIVDPGAVIGPAAEIGSGTLVAANAVIGPSVRIGRDCSIGPGATVMHALIGNRVILHAGTRIGQDGFGFAMGPQGHLKVPQIGRVIIQDDVEVGANTAIDRGGNRDTVVGEGTKIDNLVQIGHNVVIGRHCVIVAQVGISGSVIVEDFAVIAGQVGVAGHLRIGRGATIAGSSNIMTDVPAGAKWGGTPAKPVKDWFREMAIVSNLVQRWRRGDRQGLIDLRKEGESRVGEPGSEKD